MTAVPLSRRHFLRRLVVRLEQDPLPRRAAAGYRDRDRLARVEGDFVHRHVAAPEGRILFAGEHASLAHTWMQGALESALVAVRTILAGQG